MRRRQFAAPFVLVLATGSAEAGPVSKPSKCRIESTFKCPPPSPKHRGTCNPPPPKYHPAYEAQIRKRERQDDRVVLFVSIGLDDGIAKEWKAALIAPGGAVVPGKTVVVKIGKTEALVYGPVLSDEAYENLRVRFTAC
jgi:hypothetical protein